MAGKTKVYELAKELGFSNQQLLDTLHVLGMDIKSPTSSLGTEEVRLVRKHCETMPRLGSTVKKKVAAAPTEQQKATTVTEKRVGSTVIRRRRVNKPKVVEPPAEAAPPKEEEIPVVEAKVASEPEQTAPVEKEASKKAAPAPEVIEEAPKVEAPKVQPTKESKTAAKKEEKVVEAKPKKVEKAAPRKRAIPSIIKRVATDEHLDKEIGIIKSKPKSTKKSTSKDAEAGSGREGDTGSMPRKMKEISVIPEPVAAKEASKRRMLDRQQSVFRNTDFLKRELVRNSKKKKAGFSRPGLKTKITQKAAHKRVVEMGNEISIAELAAGMSVKSVLVLKKLMEMGAEVTSVNSAVDFDTASLVAQEYAHEVKQKIFDEKDYLPEVEESEEDLVLRPPVVTVMGHVDHGKTSVLDAIRKASVADGEKGGITQHIGAYTVSVNEKQISFIDTPGHAAFTEMRARGASVTDIVILVVSAVDGVMPQTIESISHAKAAGVPIVVAVNKIDLPEANAEKTKQTLAGHELTPEDWGGDTIFVNVSAKTGEGLETLLENVLLQAEVLELKANPKGYAEGVVIESKLDKGRGPTATVLVQRGQLKSGNFIVCGTGYGKVRAMTDYRGKKVITAGPSDPVEILGLSEVPNAGDRLNAVKDEKTGKALIESKIALEKKKAAEARPKMTIEEMLSAETTQKELRLIVKSDVQGSFEAIKIALSKIPQDKVKVKVLHAATGGVTESDVMLAAASQAAIVGFTVRPDAKAMKAAEKENVEIKSYSIIYELLDEVKALMEGLLDKVVNEKVIGRAAIRDVFKIPKIGAVAGSSITEGKVTRNCFLRLLRESRVIYEGKVSSLRRFKDDVKEVAQGMECGIGLENFNDLKSGDELEAFVKEEIKGTL